MTKLEKYIKGLLDNSLTYLELGRNLIDSEGAAALATALENNTSLTSLNLYGNNIGPEGAKAIAIALEKNTSLTSLYLSYNNIGSEGAEVLAEALENNTSLTSLDLNGNSIGPEGAKALAEALEKNSSLTSLDLYGGDNYIDPEGAKALAAALEKNTSLTSLNIYGDQIDDEGAKAIVKALINPKCSLMEIKTVSPFQEACNLAINLRLRVEKFTKFLLGRNKRLGKDSALQMLIDDMVMDISDILVTQFISTERQKIKEPASSDIFDKAFKEAIAENKLFPTSSIQNPIYQSLISQDRQITL